ncbi:MAG TPA: hypothetical protein VKX25_11165 [Bryobacteraceae bacterium]|jgi:hypothetical protein|nr:hypothetical protein [Bryobacteraceae bacterium]
MRLFAVLLTLLQLESTAPRKPPSTAKPECSAGAVCFTGEVKEGEAFRYSINSQLDFVLIPAPQGNPSGWTMEIEPKHPGPQCHDFVYVVNPPYREHSVRYIDTSYGWKAEDVVADTPREFKFVTNCSDYQAEGHRLDILLWPYTYSQQQYDEALGKLGSSPLGQGRLWITASRTSHANSSDPLGRIDWIRFAVELKLPSPAPKRE